ncbi:hypothetical protein CSKR_105131 [Clonorchis sinensis]|uniref:Uncharacterized protein n=1 Tax=Clonorchis sinensis TaxID=79923 RepID=A0A419PJR1_CLOSI|nr:hypothetical protein CSKR_105131 [Clonorchis sinensis]
MDLRFNSIQFISYKPCTISTLAPAATVSNTGKRECRTYNEALEAKVRGSNPTSASRLPLSRLGKPGSIPALVLPSGGMALGHLKLQLNHQCY